MKRILFTHSYFYRFDSKQWKTAEPYPPYGTIYAAALMREKGYEVDLFDSNLAESPEEILSKLTTGQYDYLCIYDDGFNYLTKMCLTKMRQAAFDMASWGKENNCTVIVSSSDSSDHYADYLNAGADFVLIGEAEYSLMELCETLDGEMSYKTVKGISYLEGGEAVCSPKRPVIRNLDDLPDPAWDLIDIEPYRDIWMNSHGYFSINMATTRGCPFKCNWCAKPIYGNRYNSRSPERVLNEMAMLQENFDVHHFWMCDDIFGLKPGWVKEFNQIIKEKGLKFKYKIQSRVDLLLKEDTITELAESGLEIVWLGAESGSQKILDAMDKGTQVEHIFEATRKIKAQNIKVAFFLQFGYLGEEKEDIDKTIEMVQELLPDDIGISVSYPLPGTVFYERVKSQLGEKKNWSDSDDLDLMYRGTFSPQYYRRLHRYVHKVYRRQQAWQTLKNVVGDTRVNSTSNWRSVMLLPYYLPGASWDKFQLQRLENA